MSKSLISIDVLGFDVCSDMGDSVYRHKAKINRHLIRGYSKISQFIGNSFSVKTAVLDYDNAIELPCDFIYESKIGVRRNGYTAILTLDKSIERHKLSDTETCNYLNDIWTNGYGNWDGYFFYNAYRGTMFLGELYGAGRCVLNNGTYNIDRDTGTLFIGSHIPKDAEIIIEYKSDGISEGLKLVPMEMAECLTFYAKWKFYADRDRAKAYDNEKWFKRDYNQLQRLYNFESALYATGKINEMFTPTNF